MPPPLSSLPDDPARWVTGHELVADGTLAKWDYDPKIHKKWEDPAIRRRLIGTPDELKAVADAVVHQRKLIAIDPDGNKHDVVDSDGNVAQDVIIEDLLALIEAVQSHPDVRLAHVDTEKDADGFLRVKRRWITNVDGVELPPNETESTEPTEPSHLQLWQCIVLKAECSDLDTRIAFYARARFVADALFIGANFADMASFRWMSFAADTRFDGASFAGVARFNGASFTALAGFERASFAGDAVFEGATINGHLLFTRATIDRRLVLDGGRITDATLGPDGRLGFDKLVVRTEASVEVSEEQLRLR